MKTYGLIGRNISYSFSRNFFSEKFKAENIDAEYLNFDISEIGQFPEILKRPNKLRGLNVTIPYKEKIIPFLDSLDPVAEAIGAVNTIKVHPEGWLTGYNTDYFGFSESLKPYLKNHHTQALILGTGGASKAVAYALQKLDISYSYVSRTAGPGFLTYGEVDASTLKAHTLIINCTPLGTFPNVEETPAIPTGFLSKEHLVFDLIYNPPVTRFMQLAKENGSTVLNGRRMLELQAEKAWEIWNS